MSYDLSGKTILITGGNAGIGFQTALALAKGKGHVIIACRSEEKAKEAVQKIQKESGNEQVDWMKLDLASLESVRTFAKEFKSKKLPINILINNAGLMYPTHQKTVDGFEINIGTNHLGHFLLTNLLLEEVKQGKGRIVNVSSVVHKRGEIKFDDLQLDKKWPGGMGAYANSKLANILFTNELQKRLSGTGVDCFSLHPGFISSEFGKDLPAYQRFFLGFIQKIVAIDVVAGSLTTIFAATSPTLTGKGGAYLDNQKIVKPAEKATNEEDAKRLWEMSEKLVGLV